MKVIHSNTKSLQPIPTETGIRSNVFSNTNNTNQILPTNGNISVGQNNSPVVQNTSAKNGNAFPFFALVFCTTGELFCPTEIFPLVGRIWFVLFVLLKTFERIPVSVGIGCNDFVFECMTFILLILIIFPPLRRIADKAINCYSNLIIDNLS